GGPRRRAGRCDVAPGPGARGRTGRRGHRPRALRRRADGGRAAPPLTSPLLRRAAMNRRDLLKSMAAAAAVSAAQAAFPGIVFAQDKAPGAPAGGGPAAAALPPHPNLPSTKTPSPFSPAASPPP